MNREANACLDAARLTDFLRRTFGESPEGVIFDCDGVLVDSCAANVRYYNLVREGLGLPPITPDQERYVQMSTAEQALDAIIPKALRPALREVAARISYRRDILPLLRPSGGLRELLDACRSRGIRLGVHTNRLDGMGDLLEKCDLEGMFDPVITAACGHPKPDPHGTLLIVRQWALPPDRLLFVGDSTTDRDAAAAAGVPFLAYRNPDLTPMGCCCAFDDLRAALSSL